MEAVSSEIGEKRTVHSVSAGEYSDYTVLALFEDRADAETAAARHPHWYVQDFDLYPTGSADAMIPRRRFSAVAFVDREGRINDVIRTHDWLEYPDEGPQRTYTDVMQHSSCLWPVVLPDGSETAERIRGGVFQVYAHADEEKRARKAVRERAAKVASILVDGGDPLRR
jgi:hypothetical protein